MADNGTVGRVQTLMCPKPGPVIPPGTPEMRAWDGVQRGSPAEEYLKSARGGLDPVRGDSFHHQQSANTADALIGEVIGAGIGQVLKLGAKLVGAAKGLGKAPPVKPAAAAPAPPTTPAPTAAAKQAGGNAAAGNGADGVMVGKKASLREQYLGRTPGKDSRAGKEVQDKMRAEGKLRDGPNGTEFKASDGEWYSIKDADMAHKTDAVSWWNETKRDGSTAPSLQKLGTGCLIQRTTH